jgi:hypothetical protein
MKHFLQTLRDTFSKPSLKQKEAYGRFCHTLAAACIIGSATLLFGETMPVARYADGRIVAMLVAGVLLFLVGGILSKGE